MTTSGSADFNLNRNQIIYAALRKLGAIQSGETPNANTVTDCAQALNAMIKRWDARGIHLWTESQATLLLQPNQVQYAIGPGSPDNCVSSFVFTQLSANAASGATTVDLDSTDDISNTNAIGVTLSSGTVFWTTVSGAPSSTTVTLGSTLTDDAVTGGQVFAYTIANRIIRPLRVPFGRRYNYQSAIDTPLLPLSRKDYFDLPNKTNTGTVTQYFYDPQLVNGQMYVWPAPYDATNAIKFTWYRPIQDFDTAANTPDLPQEWLDTIIFNLAVVMAPEYDCPPQRFAMIKGLADDYLDSVTGWDREPESTYFGVNFDNR